MAMISLEKIFGVNEAVMQTSEVMIIIICHIMIDHQLISSSNIASRSTLYILMGYNETLSPDSKGKFFPRNMVIMHSLDKLTTCICLTCFI